jgi:Xaa-Pro aminopeptidase
MRKSAAIAASGLQLAMQRTRPGVFEFQIASTFGGMKRVPCKPDMLQCLAGGCDATLPMLPAIETDDCAGTEHHCKMLGAEGIAYTPIVASGPDACTIHYSRNDKVSSRMHAPQVARCMCFYIPQANLNQPVVAI